MAQRASDLIFITGRQRSGTTVFRRLLAAHGALDADEIFHEDLGRPHRFYNFVLERVATNAGFVVPASHRRLFPEFIARLRAAAMGAPIAIDVKYFAYDMIPPRAGPKGRQPFIVSYMRESGSHVFHIVRRNKLRAHISELLAKASGRWSGREAAPVPPPKQAVFIPPSRLLRIIPKRVEEEGFARDLLTGAICGKELVYEEMFTEAGLFSDVAVEAARLALGVDRVESKPAQTRQNPEPLAKLIANYEEIRRALAGTEYEWMLE